MPNEIIVDNFAGGGGASLGIERALGVNVEVAINHDADAIRMHEANHPLTRHFQEDVWAVDPFEACQGAPVGLAWFSPDCKHFSKAKGGQPRDAKVRGLAWVVLRWAKKVQPRVIMLENVEEFEDWGPLDEEGNPIPEKRGTTFRLWVNQLRGYGYQVDWRLLTAADYGAPTTRKRLFLIARRDGRPIVWPDPTHGDGKIPHRAAAECILWDQAPPSIFHRSRPLVENSLRRIANGIKRYTLDNASPFIVRSGHWSSRPGAETVRFRGQGLDQPLATVCASTNDKLLVSPFVVRYFGGVVGRDAREPLPTITAIDHHALLATFLERHGIQMKAAGPAPDHRSEVRAFLKYYGAESTVGQTLDEPMHTIHTKDCFALVEVEGVAHEIVDIGLRMLLPRELYNAQGFDQDYIIDRDAHGASMTKKAQVKLAGNSVCPGMAEALVRANVTLN